VEEPKPVEKIPAPKVESKPEPKPALKPEPKPEAKTETPKPAEPAPKAQPKAREAAAPPTPKPTAPPAGDATAAPEAAAEKAPAADPYAAAAERWRAKTAGGLAGADTGSGPIGSGGQGPGGGGQQVGVEFLAYRQQVINLIKGRWTNAVLRPGLVAIVRFEIAANGAVTGIQIEQSSGNAAYDATALRAVQHAGPLPPPPSRYAKEFEEFVVEFHSEEPGGQEAG
jgi:TolA protein